MKRIALIFWIVFGLAPLLRAQDLDRFVPDASPAKPKLEAKPLVVDTLPPMASGYQWISYRGKAQIEDTGGVRNCNFLRLKMLNIGYQFPRELVGKCGLSSASIALQGSNLFTITDLVDMDPEQTTRGYPIQRSYGVTLNLGL